jgi:hypothetical protein
MKLINNTCPECDTFFDEELLKDADGVIFEGDEHAIVCCFCGKELIVTVEEVVTTVIAKLREEEPDDETA